MHIATKYMGFLNAGLLKIVVFLSCGKMQKCKINKMAYFGVELNSVKNILKAIPEAKYSCSRSLQSKW